MNRSDNRSPDALRSISFQPGIAGHADGSVLVSFGETKVICSAMIENKVPRWMHQQNVSGGWLTAEYSMLPYSSIERKQRDSTKGKIDGRSIEIQRLIGRSLRAVVDLKKLGQRTLWVDCDVLKADGGTRTAAITGACVATAIAFNNLIDRKVFVSSPLRQYVAAVSAGIVDGVPLLDLPYVEDKAATVDFNVVMTSDGQYVEVQGSGEEATFSPEQMAAMLELASKGITELIALQRAAIESAG